MLRACLIAGGVICLIAPAPVVAATSATISAPRSATIGGRAIHVSAKHLSPARGYALTLVAQPAPTRLTVCVARLAVEAARSTSVHFTAKIPARLHCYENDSVALGSVATSPGSYHLIVAVPDGPSGFSAGSFVRVPVKLVG
jgi:hypothetical protein